MGTISVSLPSDGTTADVSDYNTPINTVVNEINGNLDNANIKTGAAIATAKLADDAGITRAKIDWSSLSNNIKSAQNTSAPALTNTSQNLASSGLSLSFTVTGTAYALVTVSLGVHSTSDFEFRPEIRLGGTVVHSFTPAAALANASGRAVTRGFTMLVTLANGANTLSAGVTLSAATSPSIVIGGGSISALVLGNVTA